MYAGDIMQRHVVAVRADDTFAEAARVLREHHISSVIVQDGDRPSGIVTERDVVNAVAEGLDPGSTKVSERMTRELTTIEPKTDIADAARVMAERRIRHLPVVDRGELVGIISIRDLLSWAVEEVTGGHELPDFERSSAALAAAVEVEQAEA
jgi:CBS domain-containing protein